MADRQDRRDKIWEDRAEDAADRFTDHPGRSAFGLFLKVCLAVVVLVVVGGVIFGAVHWIGSWGGEAARISGPENTRTQVTAVLDDWEKMQASACNALQAQDSKHGSDDPTLVEDPALAYKATYRNISADYNRRMNNLFEAGFTKNIPLPDTIHNLPRHAPTLEQAQQANC